MGLAGTPNWQSLYHQRFKPQFFGCKGDYVFKRALKFSKVNSLSSLLWQHKEQWPDGMVIDW